MFEMEAGQLFEMVTGPWRLDFLFETEAGQLFDNRLDSCLR